jgi:hypothetical protein
MTLRFPLQVPVTYRWQGESGTLRSDEGVSRDLSDQGAFIVASHLPPVGSMVDLKIALDSLHEIAGSLPLEFQGRVLRVENSKSGSGFAISRKLS